MWITPSQRSALVGLLMEYVKESIKPGSELAIEFTDCSTSEMTTYTPTDLLNILTGSTPPTDPPKQAVWVKSVN